MSKLIKNIAFLGKISLILVLLVTIADLILGGSIFSMLTLNVKEVIEGSQYWRLFTYAFVIDDLPSAFIFIATFIFLLPQLQEDIPKQIIVPLSLVLILFQGISFTVWFWGTGTIYSGMDGLSVFYLTLASLLLPNARIYFAGRRLGKNLSVTAGIFIAWVLFSLLQFQSSVNPSTFLTNSLASLLFGFCFAALLYLNLRLLTNYFKKDIIRARESRALGDEFDDEDMISSMDYSPSTYTESKQSARYRISKGAAAPIQEQVNEPDLAVDITTDFSNSDEAKLNNLLEKISEHGSESLNEQEKLALELLSRKL
ncbi:MAG: hypothetical protein Kapaf2KO_13990 [Candidatus Kapaibacteriales bacterium]